MNLPTYVFGTIQTKAYRILREHVQGVLNKYNMTPASWSALGVIMQSPNGVQQATIAEVMHVKAPLVTILIKDLLKQEVVASVRNQLDGRAKLLAITEQGRNFVEKIEAELQDELLPLLNNASQKELVAYHRVLELIIKNDIKLKKV